jgi:hypothetical protein
LASRVIVLGFILVIFITILVYMVEFFIPLSAKADMNTYCRNTLFKMEVMGGLSKDDKDDLQNELESKGFSNIIINGTPFAKHGKEITLHVEAEYTYSKLTGLFIRRNISRQMVYKKMSIARKVVN